MPYAIKWDRRLPLLSLTAVFFSSAAARPEFMRAPRFRGLAPHGYAPAPLRGSSGM